MYLSTNYLTSFFYVSRLCCAAYSSFVLSLPLILSFFFAFIPSFPLLLTLFHMYDCTHAIAYMLTTYMSLGFVFFFLYQFGQVEIRDIGEIVIVLLLLGQLKYTHACTVSSNYFVCLWLFFFVVENSCVSRLRNRDWFTKRRINGCLLPS